jgi:hypothetical protein
MTRPFLSVDFVATAAAYTKSGTQFSDRAFQPLEFLLANPAAIIRMAAWGPVVGRAMMARGGAAGVS